jgi:hypothetical protein
MEMTRVLGLSVEALLNEVKAALCGVGVVRGRIS